MPWCQFRVPVSSAYCALLGFFLAGRAPIRVAALALRGVGDGAARLSSGALFTAEMT